MSEESFTFVDLFCGAGGSIDGLVAAGGRLVLGANHWERAIETVSTNHPDADYLQADINNYDMRRLPRSITSVDHHALVVPYRRGRAKSAGEPLLTLGTRDSAGLCSVEAAAMDCHYRMLTPREHLRGQRFRDDYEVKGNLGEQTMQAGNAVPCNVAQWIGSKLAEALG